MINANMEKKNDENDDWIVFLISIVFWEPSAFPSQPELNPRGHTSSSSTVNPSESMRKVNIVTSLRSSREIDNQVGNSNESCKYPHSFFQKFSSSSSPKTCSSSKSRDITDNVPSDSAYPLPFDSPSNKEELKEKDSTGLVDPSCPKDSSSLPSIEKIHNSLPPLPHNLKRKIKLMLIRCERPLKSKSTFHYLMLFSKYLNMLGF